MYPDISEMRKRLEALEAKDRAAFNAAMLALEAALAARCEAVEARFKLAISFDKPHPEALRCRRDLRILVARRRRGCFDAVRRVVEVSALSRFSNLMFHG
jgi:hypothetical protein